MLLVRPPRQATDVIILDSAAAYVPRVTVTDETPPLSTRARNPAKRARNRISSFIRPAVLSELTRILYPSCTLSVPETQLRRI
jgi:hypothetical protein